MGDASDNMYFDLPNFDALTAAGFNAVRLAVDWHQSIDNQTLEIDPAYLEAV